MGRILWSDGLVTGLSDVDDGHKEFVALLNELEEDIISQAPLKSIKSNIDDIYDWAKGHFELEERLMREFSYSGYESRLEYHQHFLAELEFFVNERLNVAQDEAYYECYDFLYSWFFTHVMEKDMRFIGHIIDQVELNAA